MVLVVIKPEDADLVDLGETQRDIGQQALAEKPLGRADVVLGAVRTLAADKLDHAFLIVALVLRAAPIPAASSCADRAPHRLRRREVRRCRGMRSPNASGCKTSAACSTHDMPDTVDAVAAACETRVAADAWPRHRIDIAHTYESVTLRRTRFRRRTLHLSGSRAHGRQHACRAQRT